MTTELVWSTVKPTFEEVKGKEIKFIWRLKSNGKLTEDTCYVDGMVIYNAAFDDMFICYADLTAPVSPLPLWGVKPFLRTMSDEKHFCSYLLEKDGDAFTLATHCYPTEAEAILAWNRIAKPLNEVER